MAKCNNPGCAKEGGGMGLCLGCLADYRGGNTDLRRYLKPGTDTGTHKEKAPAETAPKALRCLVPGCKRDRKCRGLCASHYAASVKNPDTPGGKAALAAILAPTRGPGKGGDKKARGFEHFDPLIAMLREVGAGRIAVLRDKGRDELTVIDKVKGNALRFAGASRIEILAVPLD